MFKFKICEIVHVAVSSYLHSSWSMQCGIPSDNMHGTNNVKNIWIYFLFFDTVISSDYVVSNGRLNSE
jgi:hypothetical protein